MFADRVDAGVRLAARLSSYSHAADTVVLGIPRGGVVVAAEVARVLGLPLDVVVTAKIGAPGNPEYAAGAVAADGVIVVNPEAGFSAGELEAFAGPARAKVERGLRMFGRDGRPPDVSELTAIVVDDGLATGLTALATVGYLRRVGAKRVVLAVPVASRSAAQALAARVDELVAVDIPVGFSAVGQFYRMFDQTEDVQVERLLSRAREDARA